MTSPEIGFLFLWTFALWALGWLALPLSARLFPALPDLGLSAARFGFFLCATLFIFWGASLKLVALSGAPAVLFLLASFAITGWLNTNLRAQIWAKKRSLAVSDAIFLLFWAAFLWLRLRHPSLNEFEKPMDMALLAGAMRADFLPFPNPWLADSLLTNYYYFGYLMSATMGKVLNTPPHLAYNLAQAAFCAFFLSLSASLGAGLLKSWKWGVALAILVALGGHLEPLRQLATGTRLTQLDWWATSRVIPHTINEYPAFTLMLGDLHGHFFALAFAAFWLVLLFQLSQSSGKRAIALLAVCGATLGAWLMTNTWDAPLFGLLLLLVGLRGERKNWLVLTVFPLALLVAAPYLLRFKSQVSGVQFALWLPNPISWGLLWGGWILLALLAFWLLKPASEEPGENSPEKWRQNLLLVGILALLAPCFFYIRGYFGDGELRHQDTVFKFGLQAWILLGFGIGSEFLLRLRAAPPKFRLAVAPLLVVLALAPLAVFRARSFDYAPGGLSLNGMKFLPLAQQNAVLWLQNEAPRGAVLLERPQIENGTVVGDYNPQIGKMATFSGVPTLLGWPQHVWFWGANYGQVMSRGQQIEAIFQSKNWQAAREMGATLVFFEKEAPPSSDIIEIKKFAGSDGSTAAIGILK